MTPYTAVAINCSLKRSSDGHSSTDSMIDFVAAELRKQGMELLETIRIAVYNVVPGVASDQGEGDDWSDVRREYSPPTS